MCVFGRDEAVESGRRDICQEGKLDERGRREDETLRLRCDKTSDAKGFAMSHRAVRTLPG